MPYVEHAGDREAAIPMAMGRAPGSWRTPRVAVAAMFLLNGSLFGVWASRIPAFAERFDLSPERLGLLLLCMAVGAIVAFPAAGRLSDRHGAGAMSRVAAILYVASLWLVAVAPSVWTLAGGLLVFGAMQGALDVTMNAWGAEVEQRLGRPIMSSLHAMFSLGAGLGAASGFVAATYGVPAGQHILLASLLIGAGTILAATVPWSSPRPEEAGGAAPVLPRGDLALVGLVAFCATLSEGAVADWSAVFLHDVRAVSEGQAALGYAAFSAAMVIMRLLGDRIVERWGPRSVARLSGVVAAIGVIAALLGQGLPIILAGFVLMGIGYANVAPLAFSRAGADPTVPPGSAIASVATFGYGGLLLGPAAIGWIAGATSLSIALALLAVLAVLISCFGASLEDPRRTAATEA